MHAHRPGLTAILSKKGSVLAVFAAVHILFLLLLTPRIAAGNTYGDVSLYRDWAFLGLNEGTWQGVDVPWVYPIAAMFPMLAAALFGPAQYMLGWFLLCTVLNLGAVLALLTHPAVRFGWQAAYLWLLLTAILGPLSFSRVDGLSGPIVVVGLVLAASHPAIASAVLSVATWIKVWPAAVVLALLMSSRAWLRVLVAGMAVSAFMVCGVLAGGGARNLLGFIQAQGERGMQLEAPLTTPGLWQAVLDMGTHIHPNFAITTMEIRGGLADPVGALMNPLLAVTVVLISLLILAATRRKTERLDLLLVGALALVSAMIVFNKVGSPQFMIWLVAVVSVGVAVNGWRWAVPAATLVVVAILTTLVYPLLYMQLLIGLNPGVAALLTARNALVVMLLGWAVLKLVGIVRPGRTHAEAPVTTRLVAPSNR